MNGEYLHSLRLNKMLSAAKLASEIGVSWQFIRQMERNEKKPSIETAQKLAKALNVTIDELVNGKPA